jgi:hypothetical protein
MSIKSDVIREVFRIRKKPDVIRELFNVELDDLEREYQAGKREALCVAIAHCLYLKKQPPEWARKDFCDAVLWGVGPWENDFGHRRKEESDKDRSRMLMAVDLFNRVEALREENPVDPALFEKVGEEFNVSPATASALYYNKEVREVAVNRNATSAYNQMMNDEVGPNADVQTKDAWLKQNIDRFAAVRDSIYSAVFKQRPRKSKSVISKKIRSKI